jgi:IS605 OrfB family transposase
MIFFSIKLGDFSLVVPGDIRYNRVQSRRTTHENHLVSKIIVDYAASHRRAIVLEDLGSVRSSTSKIRGYAERSQWAYFQLLTFILYKAALRGVMVFQVSPAYTSQECSRCGAFNSPNGKKYRCAGCGHKDHRDANSGFVIASRIEPIGGFSEGLSEPSFGSIGGPVSGTDWCGLGTVSLMPCQ